MPQVDLEALVCGGSDAAKVSCETLATGGDAVSTAAEDPNLPAESFQLRIGDEIGWTDINAVYDRDDSTKGNTNPKSQQHHGGHSKPPKSISQRFSGNLAPKAPIIGLPNKIQHSGYLGNSRRLPKGRAFPKSRRGGGGGRKAAVPPESEPGSPKVSFFGKVLSERERCRRQRDESGGCWAGIIALLRCGGGCRAAASAAVDEPVERKPALSPVETAVVAKSDTAAAPGLGAMKQFTSRRRTASWGGDAEESGTLDVEVWARRSVGSLEDYRGRDW